MAKTSLINHLDGNDSLDLSLKNLEEVPVQELEGIPRVKHLDLSCNLLTFLPDRFCLLTSLVKLDLSKNKLTRLPDDFGNLVNLQHLDLLGNQLSTLPLSFSNLKSLRWLDLKDNPLEYDLRSIAGFCQTEEECQACAQQVVAYFEKRNLEAKKKTRQVTEKDGWRWPKLFSMLSFGVIVLLALGSRVTAHLRNIVRDGYFQGFLFLVCTPFRWVRNVYHFISSSFNQDV